MSKWYISSGYDDIYLAHHGILGQKWGIRRYQNKDGSLTPEGKQRYGANFEKGIPKAKLKKALRDYNLRTGSKIKLKDARTIKVGNYIYDRKGRRVYEDSSAQSNKKEEPKASLVTAKKNPKNMTYQELQDAINLARAREDYNKYYGPKPKPVKEKKQSAAGQFVKKFAGRAVSNIADAALDSSKKWMQDQFNEAFGLNKNEVRDARTLTELFKKDRSKWTMNDYSNFRNYMMPSTNKSGNVTGPSVYSSVNSYFTSNGSKQQSQPKPQQQTQAKQESKQQTEQQKQTQEEIEYLKEWLKKNS